MYLWTSVRIYDWIFSCLSAFMHVRTSLYFYVCVYMSMCMYVWMCVRASMCHVSYTYIIHMSYIYMSVTHRRSVKSSSTLWSDVVYTYYWAEYMYVCMYVCKPMWRLYLISSSHFVNCNGRMNGELMFYLLENTTRLYMKKRIILMGLLKKRSESQIVLCSQNEKQLSHANVID